MFTSATVRLTAAYLAIIMAISIFFSALLYQVSVGELREGLRRQVSAIQQLPRFQAFIQPGELRALEAEQLARGTQRIVNNLFVTNLVILVLAGAGSFILARRTLRPIEEAMETQSRFTADASHELRTPLTAMRTEIEVALRSQKTSKADLEKLLSSNLEEVGRLQGLADRLLQLARQETKANLEFNHLSLAEIADYAISNVSAQATKKKISLSNEIGEHTVFGNYEYLTDLFTILLDNAVKYSRTSGNVELTAKGTRQVTVSIKDDGAGIRASDLPHVFDRFYRSDTSRSKQGVDGYGLGLAIAKQIVELHGGSISLQSQPQKGTVATITLPA